MNDAIIKYVADMQEQINFFNKKENRDKFVEYIEGLRKEIERLNNIINSLEETLNKLIKEQLEEYHKREENWEERRNVSNTWLTSRDCYYSILKYLKELKGVDKP